MRSEPPTGDELTRMLVSMKRNVLQQAAKEPAPAKRTSRTDRIVGGVLGAALLVGVAAGAAFIFGIAPLGQYAMDPASTPTLSPTPTASPTPTPTPTPVEPPANAGPPPSVYGLDCSTLVDPGLVSDLFPTDVAPADPIVTASGDGVDTARRVSVLSLGGTVCEWSNGAPYNDRYSLNADYVGVSVSVVPRPAEGWSERAVRLGLPGDRSACDEVSCTASIEVGDAWVAVEANPPHGLNASAWQPFVDAVIQAVSAAGPAGELIPIQRTGKEFPLECGAIIPLDAVRAITGIPDAESHGGALGGGWSEWAEARYHANNVGCVWNVGDTDEPVTYLEFVREGSWAYERMLQAGTSVPVEIAGLGADDEAVLRCDGDYRCAVDLRIGQDWFNVWGADEAQAIALAEAAVAQLARS